MRRFFATTLGQILTVVVCSTLATLLLSIALVFVQNTQPGPPWPYAVAHRIVNLVNLLEGVPEHRRPQATLLAAAQRPDLSVAVKESASACGRHSLAALTLEARLRAELRHFPHLTVAACGSGNPATDIQVIVPMGGHVLEIRTGNIRPSAINFRSPAFAILLLMFISVIAISIWAIWRVVGPLRRLSEKADAFGRDIASRPIVEEGPAEIRNVARTFNLMQERVTRSIQERTRMLAAISHDLRTPLTRIRLQLESPDKDADPGKLLRNVDLMQAMLSSALAFLNEGHDNEEKEWVDLDALLLTLSDEYEDSGTAIHYEGPGSIRFLCRPNAVRRALANLIDNAIHFGHSTKVTASIEGRSILIEVADDGPGIPPQHLHEVLEPFVRLDPSRNDRKGSIGLGLSIVNEIVQAHGGTLTLANRRPGGLVARILFPITPP